MQPSRLRSISFVEALVPFVVLILLLSVNGYVFGSRALEGASQVALVIAAMVGVGIAACKGYTWSTLQAGILENIHTAMPSILILLMVGALSGTWLLGGIIPTMIYYGLKILSPGFFLVASCIICVIVASGTGSSWSTIATVGIALLGIGKTLGWSEDVVAGAIISGAYCGDKLSPLSDTTHMASGVTATPLFTHIRHMLLTSVPTFVLTLIIFGIIGWMHPTTVTLHEVAHISHTLQNTFWISPWLLLAPVGVMIMIVQQVPALPALLVGTLLGGGVAVCCQAPMVLHVAGGEILTSTACYKAVITAMCNPIRAATGDPMLDHLLSSNGTQGMLGTIWLILTAMIFGGVMESTGMLQIVAQAVIGNTRTAGTLISSTVGACIFFNLTASDQYLAILLSGKIYAPLYKQAGLASHNLSRALEDGATVTSPLIPWNTCGATQAAVLGVATWAYLPYCFFNLINPLVAIVVGYWVIQVPPQDANTLGKTCIED